MAQVSSVYSVVRASLWLSSLVFLGRSLFAQSDAPIHYYDAAIGKTGSALKAALQGIIKNHTVVPYTSTSTDTWDALKVLDEDPTDSNNVVLVYSGLVDQKSDQYTGSSGSWDREHLWPQSFGIVALNSNSRAKSDLFNLRPINTSVNSVRGNKYYDYSTAPISTRPDAPGSSYDSNSWEARDADKGPIARGMFYMAVRYDGSDADVPDLELSDTPDAAQYRFGKLTSLLAWHRQFAVAGPERQRNATIYSVYQHNRNPFIDHPDYAEMVFLGVTPGQAWRDTNFTNAELVDSSIGGDAADPDDDGVSNALEYVFNRDPWQAEQGPLLSVSETAAASSYTLRVGFPHNRNATDESVTYESSSDFKTWTPISSPNVSAVPTSSETEQVTATLSTNSRIFFVRIRATKIGP